MSVDAQDPDQKVMVARTTESISRLLLCKESHIEDQFSQTPAVSRNQSKQPPVSHSLQQHLWVQPRTGCQGLTHSLKLVGKTETSQPSTRETLEEKIGAKQGRVLPKVTRVS